MNQNLSLLLVGSIAALGAVAIFLWIRWRLERRRAEIQRRLGGSSEADILAVALVPLESRGWFGRMDASFDDMIRRTSLEAEPGQALALIALVAVVVAAMLYVWRGELWLSILGMVLGGGGTLLTYVVSYNRYRQLLSDQLPDAFYLLARSIRAGLSLEQAIALTGEQSAKPLADEFRRCAAQLQLGLAIPLALGVVAKRLRLLDFNVFASTVSLYCTMGGNLALLLDRLAASTRDRNHFRGFFSTATALSRVTAVFIGLMSPLLLLSYAIFQPNHIKAFFESRNGWMALGVAAALQVIGIVWLYRLLRVRY